MNYRLLSGCFAGSVVEKDICIIDVDFRELEADLIEIILDWAETQIGLKYMRIDHETEDDKLGEFTPKCFSRIANHNIPLTWNDVKEDYENSWEIEKTDDPANLKPIEKMLRTPVFQAGDES